MVYVTTIPQSDGLHGVAPVRIKLEASGLRDRCYSHWAMEACSVMCITLSSIGNHLENVDMCMLSIRMQNVLHTADYEKVTACP